MKKETKALLYSALVFPGLGQLVLKSTRLGIVVMSLAICSLIIVLKHVVDSARMIVDRVLAGEVSADIYTIRQLVAEQQANTASTTVDLALSVLVLTWIISIIGVYLRINSSSNER